MQRIASFLLKVGINLFGLLPFRVMYILSDVLAFILYRLVAYRKQVIRKNLRRAFPEKTEAEIHDITRRFYNNLTDVLLESLRLPTLSVAEAMHRYRMVNPEVVNHYLDQNRSIILTGSHLGNWEYGGLTMPAAFHGAIITAYKPLTNKTVEVFFNRARARAGMEMVPMEDVFRTLRKRSQEAAVFILLSDQSPSSRKSAYWIPFFGTPTAFLPGMEVLSRKFDCPVIYYRTVRTRRGFYELYFEELSAHPAVMTDKGITTAYATALERDIKKQPEQWLWSHKRWKMELNDEYRS